MTICGTTSKRSINIYFSYHENAWFLHLFGPIFLNGLSNNRPIWHQTFFCGMAHCALISKRSIFLKSRYCQYIRKMLVLATFWPPILNSSSHNTQNQSQPCMTTCGTTSKNSIHIYSIYCPNIMIQALFSLLNGSSRKNKNQFKPSYCSMALCGIISISSLHL